MTSVCRRRSVGSKRAQKCSVNSVRSVRDKSPQRVTCVSSFREGVFYFSQKNTDEQNTQSFTETLSQPISQNLTANVSLSSAPNTHHPIPFYSSNVLWYLYAGGVLWVRNRAQMDSVISVSSVRDNIPTELSYAWIGSVISVSSVREKHRYTSKWLRIRGNTKSTSNS